MAKTKGKSIVSAEIPNERKVALRKRSEREGRSVSAVIDAALAFYLKHAPVWKRVAEVPEPIGGQS